MTLDLALIAFHGGLLAIAASALVMGSLRANPRLFLRKLFQRRRVKLFPFFIALPILPILPAQN